MAPPWEGGHCRRGLVSAPLPRHGAAPLQGASMVPHRALHAASALGTGTWESSRAAGIQGDLDVMAVQDDRTGQGRDRGTADSQACCTTDLSRTLGQGHSQDVARPAHSRAAGTAVGLGRPQPLHRGGMPSQPEEPEPSSAGRKTGIKAWESEATGGRSCPEPLGILTRGLLSTPGHRLCWQH